MLPPIIDPPQHSKQRLHETYVLDKKRTIILAPYARSTNNLDESFWAKLVAELARKDEYVFYTNVAAPDEKVIPDTAPIVTTLPEAMYVAENVNCFIGMRSGLFDLLAFTNVRLLYINPTISWQCHDLDINYNNTNSRAFYIGIAEQAHIRSFMERNNIKSVDDMIFFDRIRGRNIAFNTEFLLKKIVDAVD